MKKFYYSWAGFAVEGDGKKYEIKNSFSPYARVAKGKGNLFSALKKAESLK